MGGGEQIIDPPMLGVLEFRTLALLLLLRTVTTLVSYAAGTPGGVFGPMLALGTIVGMLALAHPLLPDTLVDEVGMAIAGMAGLFTATVRAPLTGIILVSELTGGFDMALATTLTCATASLTAAWLGASPSTSSCSRAHCASRGMGPAGRGELKCASDARTRLAARPSTGQHLLSRRTRHPGSRDL